MRIHQFTTACLVLLLLLAHGRLAFSEDNAGKPETAKKAVQESPPKHVTLKEESSNTLNAVVRRIGAEAGGSAVVMNGAGEKALPPFSLEHVPYAELMKTLADYTKNKCLETPHYFFFYPEDYQVLCDLNIDDAQLPARYKEARLDLSVGDYTLLYNALALASYSLDLTIVADNALAENQTGECAFHQAPLPRVLTGLLQSARIAPGAIFSDATEEYLFLGTKGTQSAASSLIGETVLDDAAKKRLAQTVSVALPKEPEPGKPFEFYRAPQKLKDALPTLSAQLGVTVKADKRLLDFPVNPCIMRKLSLRSALNLLVRQWPLDKFGYEITADGILIRPKEQ